MLVFYAVPVSNFSATMRLILRLKGVPFSEVLPPEGYGSDAYKAIVPTGSVPALVDGDLVLSESAVIAEYLEERFPEPRLVPDASAATRARVRWLARLHDARIEPPLRALFPHMSPARRDATVVEANWARFAGKLEELDAVRARTRYLAGDRATLADYVYPATLLLAERMAMELGRALPLPKGLAGWWSGLRAEPVVAAEMDAYQIAVDAWLDRKRAQA